MMIPRARALALLALFLSLGQGDLIAQDQWLSETSCSTAAHAIVNEGITARVNVEHGRAKDVPRWEKLELERSDLERFVKGLRIEAIFRHVEAGPQYVGGGHRAEDVLVPREVVGVGVRNKSVLPGASRIQPELEIGQVEPGLGLEGDGRVHGECSGWKLSGPNTEHCILNTQEGSTVIAAV